MRHAVARGLQERNAAAVDYVRASVPDAVRALRPGPRQLLDIADATLEGWLTRDRDLPDRLRDGRF